MYRDGPILFQFRGVMGVDVEVGASLLLLILFFFMASGMSGPAILFTLAFAAILVGSIYLHELGHAWGCKVQGVPVRRIVIHGGGGFCEQQRSADRRRTEFIVAMGPIVNLTIWALGSLIVRAVASSGTGAFPHWLVWLDLAAHLNLLLAIFNLMPILPLDGGRLLHLVLGRALPPDRAARITGAVGLVFSALWVVALVYLFMTTGWILLFIPSFRLHWAMATGRSPG